MWWSLGTCTYKKNVESTDECRSPFHSYHFACFCRVMKISKGETCDHCLSCTADRLSTFLKKKLNSWLRKPIKSWNRSTTFVLISLIIQTSSSNPSYYSFQKKNRIEEQRSYKSHDTGQSWNAASNSDRWKAYVIFWQKRSLRKHVTFVVKMFVSMIEMENALRSCNGTAPGHDKVHYSILKHLKNMLVASTAKCGLKENIHIHGKEHWSYHY